MYDLIIKNGYVIDGTGSPAFHGDIAVANGKIERIARNITGESKEVIDADGLTVTPGFIDSHSHSDNAIFTHPDMIEKVEQGITTSIGGQCGSSPAPVYKGVTDENALDVGEYGKQNVIYKTFGSMAKVAKDVPLGSNLMAFVGHSALRLAVIGVDNAKPSHEEMEQMKNLLREAMENGAVGLSFGLIYTPSCYAETDELIELAKVVKEYDGMISAHIRNESFQLIKAVDEFLKVVKAADVKGVLSHHKSMHKENWGKVHHSLKMIDDAVAEGYDVYCDVYPYEASHTSLDATIIPKEMRAREVSGVVEFLSHEENRRIVKEKYTDIYGENLSNLQISYCAGRKEYEGKRISEIAEIFGMDHCDAAIELIRMTKMGTGVCNFAIMEDDIEHVLRYDRAMVCTDSSVVKSSAVCHPRLRGTFPRVLGRYVRERKVISLSEAIRKCTSMPASVYGLPTKGVLREGFDADICIFDADKIIDKATFADCSQRCEGLNYVIIDGEVVAENAVYNGKRKGKFIPRMR